MRIRISWCAALLFGAFSSISAGCGGDEGTDAGTSRPDASVTPDAGEVPSGDFTFHYHRAGPVAAATYAGWTVTFGGDVESTSPIALDTLDDFGAKVVVPLSTGAARFTYQLTDGEKLEPSAPAQVVLANATDNGAWHWQNAPTAWLEAPPAVPGADDLFFAYLRDDGAYNQMGNQYGVYSWGSSSPRYSWPARALPDGIEGGYGAWFLIALTGESPDACPFGDFCFIIQAGSDATKDPSVDRGVDTSVHGNQFFLKTADAATYTCPQRVPGCILGAGETNIDGARAHWVAEDTLLWKVATAASYELRYSAAAEIGLENNEVVGGEIITLTLVGEPGRELVDRFPQLSTFTVFTIAAPDLAKVPDALRAQLVAVAYDSAGAVVAATKVQPAGVLDALYAYEGPLGLDFVGQPTVRVWAPTAQSVGLRIYDASLASTAMAAMTRNASGVWEVELRPEWMGLYYRFAVQVYHPITGSIQTYEVTDPYSSSLSANSTHSQVVDVLGDAALKPAGWDTLRKPPLDAPEDLTIYETHIRDFSLLDSTVEAADRGKFTAFTYNGVGARRLSTGMSHLARLQQAGLRVLHLLPSFDLATVEEIEANRVELASPFSRLCELNPMVPAARCTEHGATPVGDVIASFAGDSLGQQEVLGWMRDLDGFNWGYDPFHYTAPEGSYATDPMGTRRVLEMRQMVQALADIGLRVALDVVYNHTNASGTGPRSVLDRIVPWYYHRQNPETGLVVKETCCEDTATEHRMMERLMVDSVVFWAKAYKIDAFRFDLMGYHLKSNMETLQAALRSLTPATDGVNGSELYIYGEGWQPGSVGAAVGENATQLTMGGVGIGTFSDRLRDAVRGGGPFASGLDHVTGQGFISGMSYDPNDPTDFMAAAPARDATADRVSLLTQADQIRVGLAGNLAQFKLVARTGAVLRGSSLPYNGQPTGYTRDPQEVITYIEKHDNETLFDISAFKHPIGTPMAARARAQNVGASIGMLSQGVPFFQFGQDMLRSKSMDQNSYNSGDWFNALPWGEAPRWRVGLPPAGDNMSDHPMIQVVFADTAIAPTADHVTEASAHFMEMLQIRYGSPLFRLRTEAEVLQRVDFLNTGPNQIPGLIVMVLTDGTDCTTPLPDLDPELDSILVFFSANDEDADFTLAGANGFALHSVQAASADPVVRTSSFEDRTGVFTVPGRTTAVFVQAQGKGQGPGLPCNER